MLLTPLTANADPDWAPWSGAIQITAADGTVIFWTSSGGNEHANADLIVRAANSHDDMLAALREARHFMMAPAEDLLWGVIGRLDAAISKAEGRP